MDENNVATGNGTTQAGAQMGAQEPVKIADEQKAKVVIDGAGEGTANVGQINREFQEKSTLKRAKDRGLPYIDIGKTPLNPDFLKMVDVAEAKAAKLVPFFKVAKKLRVAVEDPDRTETVQLLEKLKAEGYEVEVNLASSAGLVDAFKIYDQTQRYKQQNIVETVEEKSINTYEKEIASLSDLSKKL